MLDLLQTQAVTSLDMPVRLGRDAHVAARLIAVPVPDAVAAERRRRLIADATEAGTPVSAIRLALATWAVYATTIPAADLNAEAALVLGAARWQIEVLFTLWKSHGQIDLVREVNPWRVLCELYGRLLSQIVQHWLLLLRCWDDPARSRTKAAQTIRTH